MEMFAPQRLDAVFAQMAPAIASLLPMARERLQRQGQYAQPLAKGGRKAAALIGWLDQAEACIAELARPVAVLRPVPVRVQGSRVDIAGRVQLDDPGMAADMARGSRLSLCLLSLGYGQPQAFDWLQRDYGAHHVQSSLARETLFALSRAVDHRQRQDAPGRRLVRVAVQTHEDCGSRRIWDAAQVQALLGLFAGAGAQVSLTESGCFQPLHSMLRLTYLR